MNDDMGHSPVQLARGGGVSARQCPDLFTALPLDCYRDDENSNGAGMQQAAIEMGLFDGKVVQRESRNGIEGICNRAQSVVMARCRRCPQLDTLGRELRHRKERIVNGENRQRMHFADRALVQGWRILCDNGRVWAERV